MGCQPSLFSQDRAGGGASSSMNGKPSSSRPPPPRSEPRRTEPPRSGGKPAEERARLNNNVDSKSSSKGVEERARMAEEYKRLQDKCKEMEERIRWVGHRLVGSPRLCHYEKREKKNSNIFYQVLKLSLHMLKFFTNFCWGNHTRLFDFSVLLGSGSVWLQSPKCVRKRKF